MTNIFLEKSTKRTLNCKDWNTTLENTICKGNFFFFFLNFIQFSKWNKKKKKTKKKKVQKKKTKTKDLVNDGVPDFPKSESKKFSSISPKKYKGSIPKNKEEFQFFLLFHQLNNNQIFSSMMFLFSSIYFDHKIDLWCRDWIDVGALRFRDTHKVFSDSIFNRITEQLEWAVLRWILFLFIYF